MLRISGLAVALAAAVAITACADSTAPHRDCTIVSGVQICVPQ